MDPSQYKAETQQNPNLNYTDKLSINYPYSGSSNSYLPTTIDLHAAMHLNHPPPAVDKPYLPPPPVVIPNMQNLVGCEPQQGPAATTYQDPNAAAASAYYQDPIVAAYHQKLSESWLAAITQFEAVSYSTGVATVNPAILPQRNFTKYKGPKKTTIAQSSWCDDCEIWCNSKDVLDKHKLGKKHQRNSKKLKAQFSGVPSPALHAPTTATVATTLSVSTSAPTDRPLIGPEEKPKLLVSQRVIKKPPEDLETKRRKILAEGAAAATVRACHICNVVCNSDTVFSYHLAGQKHLSKVKFHWAGQKHLSMVKNLVSGAVAM